MELTLESVKKILIQYLENIDDINQLEDDASLSDYGFDAVSVMNILFDFEKSFNTELDDAYLEPEFFQTPKTIYATLRSIHSCEHSEFDTTRSH